MALQFVPGNSGAGKSFQLYQKILQEAGEHPERNLRCKHRKNWYR